MCNNTQKKKAAGAGKDFTLFFGVMLHFNFKCVNKMLSSAYDRHTDSEQVTSLEDFDNMIKLLFGYGQKWTVILSAVNGLQNCAT